MLNFVDRFLFFMLWVIGGVGVVTKFSGSVVHICNTICFNNSFEESIIIS